MKCDFSFSEHMFKRHQHDVDPALTKHEEVCF
jgi:hypothetical protein